MNLRLKVLGFVLAEVELDIPASDSDRITVVDKGVKGMSSWWVKRMMNR